MVETMIKPQTLQHQIDRAHMPVIQDESWLGHDVYAIHDINVLIDWWNKNIRYAADQLTREIKDRKLNEFQSALWIRINQLHPKSLLHFADITKPELLKRVA